MMIILPRKGSLNLTPLLRSSPCHPQVRRLLLVAQVQRELVIHLVQILVQHRFWLHDDAQLLEPQQDLIQSHVELVH